VEGSGTAVTLSEVNEALTGLPVPPASRVHETTLFHSKDCCGIFNELTTVDNDVVNEAHVKGVTEVTPLLSSKVMVKAAPGDMETIPLKFSRRLDGFPA